jgi:hypothetical protein
VQPFLKMRVSVPGRTIPRKVAAVARNFAFTPQIYAPLRQVSTAV